jgi:hypothetical protein
MDTAFAGATDGFVQALSRRRITSHREAQGCPGKSAEVCRAFAHIFPFSRSREKGKSG